METGSLESEARLLRSDDNAAAFLPIVFEHDGAGSVAGLDGNGQFKAKKLPEP